MALSGLHGADVPLRNCSLKPKFHLAHHVSTQHDAFDVSSPCILAVSSLSNSTALHARFDALDTSNVSCRDVTWRVEWNLGFITYLYAQGKKSPKNLCKNID